MSTIASLLRPAEDGALRVGDFTLLPSNQATPIISSQPARNLNQYTWIKSVADQKIVYQKVTPSDGIYRVVEGTRLSWTVFAADPSNLNAPNSDASLRFVWRRDGTPLVEVNNSNHYQGSRTITIESAQCTPSATGNYVCEVHNNNGVVETEGLQIEVVVLDKHPKLRTNLLLNGNADSQLDGWTVDSDILSKEFVSSTFLSAGFGSLPKLHELLSLQDGNRYNTGVEFAFSQGDAETLQRAFQSWIDLGPDWRSVQPAWMQQKPDRDINEPLVGWRRWVITGVTPQIIDNESTLDGEPFGGFFPAMRYIDQFNRNFVEGSTPVIGLMAESANQRLSYFTRDKLKFLRYGGKATSQMSQTIDLTELADFIDGNVIGVSHATSQFFAYVGAGLTRYQIRAQVAGQGSISSQTFNWFVADYQQIMERLEQDSVSGRLSLVPNTPIEILPLVEDVTQVEIQYLDGDGRKLSRDLIDGPNERDVFAIKDCTFLPISLYPIFEYFITNNNPIKIFGQVYTNTKALAPLFESTSPYTIDYPSSPDGSSPADRYAAWGGDPSKLDRLTDVQAKFALTKLNWTMFGNLTPSGYNVRTNRKNRAIRDYGAAAMFGVEKTRVIPRGARSAQITVRFTHTSDTIADNDPKTKQWREQTIYHDVMGSSSSTGKQTIDYSYPRCGITKMKFIVLPNNFVADSTYPSYKLPPSNQTVVGFRKQRLSENVHNSADPESFPQFQVDTARGLVRLAAPLPTDPVSPFLSETEASFIIAQQVQAAGQEAEDRREGQQPNQSTFRAEESGEGLFE